MVSNQIKELRHAGKLEEALILAKAELALEPDNIWAKRNISWVYYDYLKLNSSFEHVDSFIIWIKELKNLGLPADEKMLFEQIGWQIGKLAFSLIKSPQPDPYKGVILFEEIKAFHFPKPTEAYSFLFKALHKLIKETSYYIQFAEWWDFKNFLTADFQKEKLPNGRELMAIAEQGYITYAKNLLPIYLTEGGILSGEISFDVEKVRNFLPRLSDLGNRYPDFQYPRYFHGKLLLALGEIDQFLEVMLPFAKKKQNDFWVWEILAEAFSNYPEKVFACYCKALTCKSPEEMLVSLRQKMVRELKQRGFFSEAKTEIELLTNTRTKNGYKIPDEVKNWQNEDWYKNSIAKKDNLSFYKQYVQIAEEILFNDIAEELVFVEFVNRNKKVLNFIVSEKKYGFFKYNHLNLYPQVGEVLKVRFQGGSVGSIYKVCSALKVDNYDFKENFEKIVSGVVRINEGNNFGFIKDYYIHPDFVSKHQLKNGDKITATIIKSFNKSKSTWGWRVLTIK